MIEIDALSNSISHQFYENEYEKMYLLGKKAAYEDIIHLIEE